MTEPQTVDHTKSVAAQMTQFGHGTDRHANDEVAAHNGGSVRGGRDQ